MLIDPEHGDQTVFDALGHLWLYSAGKARTFKPRKVIYELYTHHAHSVLTLLSTIQRV